MKFREHRGGLGESMATVIELPAEHAALVAHCAMLLDKWYFEFKPEELHVEPYAFDPRISWDSYIVTIDRYGVMGFTDGPCT
jgi:hypothetical protein